MKGRRRATTWGVVLDSADPPALARFYADLLEWEYVGGDDTFATVAAPTGDVYLAAQLQADPAYVPPTWPAVADAPQMQSHLDFEVDDLDEAVQSAQGLGARLAPFQPQQNVRVMRDPEGHLFCLYRSDSAST